MKYGARNEITATVKRIKKGEVMCQVDVSDKVKVVVKAVSVLLIKE